MSSAVALARNGFRCPTPEAWALRCVFSLFMLSRVIQRLRPGNQQIRVVPMPRGDAASRRMRLDLRFANRIDMFVEHGLPRRLRQLRFRGPAPARGG
jgi:hypothetical protein